MTTIFADEPIALPVEAPLWREAVVGASIAAMAAASGLGVYYETGAAPWLAFVTAGVTAGLLWSLHRWLAKPDVSEAPHRPAPRVARPVLPPHGVATTPALEPKAKKPDAKPELSAFVPRQATLPQPVVRQPAPGPVAARPVAAIPVAARPVAAGDADLQFKQLQTLVKQLAAEVDGPKAATPDPDRPLERAAAPAPQAARAPAPRSEAPAGLKVGFGGASPSPAGTPLGLRVAEAVAAERVDVLLEPIQTLSEQKARHFEVSVRFRDVDGNAIANTDVTSVARASGLSGSVDALKLPRVAKVAQRVRARGGAPADVLAGMMGHSLADHRFMEALASTFTDGAPTPVVLSFTQADVRGFARVHWTALDAMADMGLRFALSDVTALDMDFELLRARAFVFVKLDADVFLSGLPFGAGVIPSKDIYNHLSAAGLSLIIDHIDTDVQLGKVQSYGVAYGQGALFGGARPVKAEVLA